MYITMTSITRQSLRSSGLQAAIVLKNNDHTIKQIEKILSTLDIEQVEKQILTKDSHNLKLDKVLFEKKGSSNGRKFQYSSWKKIKNEKTFIRSYSNKSSSSNKCHFPANPKIRKRNEWSKFKSFNAIISIFKGADHLFL